VPIVRSLSLEVRAGEVLAVVGRNGVGKTTLVETVVGLLPLEGGQIKLAGADIGRDDAKDRARAGLGYVPQGRGIFARLTVDENLRMGDMIGAQGRADYEAVYASFPVLRERRRQRAGTLSGGEQQMLAIGRVIVGRPRLLILDEPSEGIQPSIVQEIARLIRRHNRNTGLTVLLVEQNIDLVFLAAVRCAVMDKGTIVAHLEPDDLADPEAARRYLAI
jgi:branched-chain amino acid transport system ATP-binding protein